MVTAAAAYSKAAKAARPHFTPANNIIFDYGHSFVARGYGSAQQSNDSNILAWACALARQRFVTDYAYASGVVGDSIAQALTRLPLAVASIASTVHIQLGTNDCNSSVPLATMQAGYLQIVNALVAAGKIIIIEPVFPNYGYFATQAQYMLMERFNQWLLTLPGLFPNIYVVDVMAYWTDLTRSDRQCPPGANGTVNPLNYTVDNVHPSSRGAFAAAIALAATLDRIAPLLPPAPMLWTPANLFDKANNPKSNILAERSQMLGTSGSQGTGVTGNTAAGWTIQRTVGADITATTSIVARTLPNGQTVNMQQVVLSNTGTVPEAIKVSSYAATPASYYTAGSATVRGSMDVEVDADAALTGIELSLNETGATASSALANAVGDYSANAAVLPPVAWTGRLRTPGMASVAGNTALSMAMRVFVGPGGTATVRWGNAQMAVETISSVSNVSNVINMNGAAARVAITDASYWIRTSGTLARSTDSAYETALKNSSSNKTVPFPSSQTIPAGSIGYVSIKHAAVIQSVSPPLFVNWDGNSASPSVASPMLPTIWYSADSVTGSPDDGTWTQDTSFACFRPNPTSDASYTGRGQRYFWPTAAARWVQVRYDATSGAQAVTPHIACSSGEWQWVVGMSIIRNQFSSVSTIQAARTALIANQPGADPFFFVTARSGSNQDAIKTEQTDVVLASATLKQFIRSIYMDPWVNDTAYTGVRPYASQPQATLDAIRARSDAMIAQLKAVGTVVVAPDLSFENFTSVDTTSGATPYVNGDIASANGSLPFNAGIFGPAIKAGLPDCWDTRYDWPRVSDYAGVANKFDTDLSDSLHPNSAGIAAWRLRRGPLDKLAYGVTPTQCTLELLVAQLGTSTTTALKTRLQSVFSAVYSMYPTSDSTALSNRTSLRATLDAIPAS